MQGMNHVGDSAQPKVEPKSEVKPVVIPSLLGGNKNTPVVPSLLGKITLSFDAEKTKKTKVIQNFMENHILFYHFPEKTC